MSISFLPHDSFANVYADDSQNLALLKAFQDLREKLKVQTKQNASLKEQLKISSIRYRQSEEALSSTLSSSIELKEKASSLQSQNEQLRKKMGLLKETVQGQANYRDEVQFTKEALLQAQTHCDALQKQREKLLEVSVAEQLQFEEELARLQSKLSSHENYMQELECNYSKCRENCLRLQNEIKKAKITYEEESFTHQWTQGNFETQHLLSTIKQLERQIATLKAKNKKEKEKRVLLEDRVIQLQELSGFHTVKANTFQAEADLLTEKCSKTHKKYKEAKHKVQAIAAEKLHVEECLAKTIVVFEELSKRLQELSIGQVSSLLQESQAKLGFLSPQRQEISEELSSIQKSTSRFMERSTNATPSPAKSPQAALPKPLETHNGWQGRQKKNQPSGTNIPETSQSSFASKQNYVNLHMYGSNMTFGDHETSTQNAGIENRVRKEREEMQRRIKEKILCRKLQSSAPSEQYKLRGEYIRSFIDRRI